MILVVSGFGYSGKSEFINQQGAGVVPLDAGAEVEYLATFAKAKRDPYDGMVLHFNIDRVGGDGGKSASFLRSLKIDNLEVRAVVLVTPETELRERIFFDGGRSGRSPVAVEQARATITEKEGRISETYETWLKALRSADIPYTVVESSGGRFRVVDEGDLRQIVDRAATNTKTRYSVEQIKSALEREIDHYHRVELPYGLHASGQDVWQRFSMIFPRNLSGWTLLDIGCAHGAFAFEAERRGAKVTGCDINPKRLEAAKLLKDLLGSSVTLTDVDYLSDKVSREAENKFDMVLALNVLHHVPEPEEALLALSRLAGRRVVLEFPTTKDPLYQNKPMRRVVGPYLVECLSLFTEVRLVQSHKEGRVIAVCFTEKAPESGVIGARAPSRPGNPRHESQPLQYAQMSSSAAAPGGRTPRSIVRGIIRRLRAVVGP